MKVRWRTCPLSALLFLGALPAGVWGVDILKTDGFSMCSESSDIQVQKMNIQYNKATRRVDFDVSGTSNKEQKVMAELKVSAYGQEVYKKSFDPCDDSTKVPQLCPLPKGTFSASGSQDIPTQFANQIPSIAFNVPDLDGTAKLELKEKDSGNSVACIQSTINNGKTMSTKAVPVIAAGIAGGALLVSTLSALGAGGQPGVATSSPTFTEVIGWFQSMALNGMLSVEYPSVYRSFAKNFAFSGGLIPWDGMERSIDQFRKMTGGNLTEDSVDFLRNATLISKETNATLSKRSLEASFLIARQLSIGQGETPAPDKDEGKTMHFVSGIQAYVEQLAIPKSNTFMTVLLIFAIVVAAIIVGILLFKVILETWGLCGKLSPKLEGFRKRYWWIMAKTITSLILVLYGVWTLYCVYQFTNGDSWAAKVLAGVTLGLFTAVLLFFTWKIWSLARKYKEEDGDASGLYEDKETWRKYRLFYENYKKNYWWLFVPTIVYMFTRGCVIAGGDGNGMVQTGGQLIVESLMLILLLWVRPYSLKSGNWINIIIQIVRVLSVLCILVFVKQLGIDQTPKTITGVVLIVMQSVLTGLLAILIAINALVIFFKTNPHRKARKEQEKLAREDNLTPLDARNSLLYPDGSSAADDPKAHARQYSASSADSYHHAQSHVQADAFAPQGFASNTSYGGGYEAYPGSGVAASQNYSRSAASATQGQWRSASPNPSMRAPLLPQVEMDYRGQRGY